MILLMFLKCHSCTLFRLDPKPDRPLPSRRGVTIDLGGNVWSQVFHTMFALILLAWVGRSINYFVIEAKGSGIHVICLKKIQ